MAYGVAAVFMVVSFIARHRGMARLESVTAHAALGVLYVLYGVAAFGAMS